MRLAETWQKDGHAPGFVLIEAPMGEGKTEAAVYLAAQLMQHYDKEGIYFALPTAATSNSMYFRIRDLLGQHDIASPRLMHGQSWLITEKLEDHPTEVTEWLAPMKRAMLSQYAIGTVDQAMMSVMKIRHTVLRLLGLSSKVLIIDEVHAYDTYMQQIIEQLLAWCAALSIPVVLLSATLPGTKRAELLSAYIGKLNTPSPQDLPQITTSSPKDYPLITMASPGEQASFAPVAGTSMRSSVQVTMHEILSDYDRIAQTALEKVSGGGCVCVMMNTVKDAQEVFKCIRAKAEPDVDISLFHARYPAGRRFEIEERAVNQFGKGGDRRTKAILVATQVVEQSIDLDFDCLITALCPIDLLLQRAGRMHRHAQTVRPAALQAPEVVVLTPENMEDYGVCVYEPIILKRTLEALDGRALICLPDDIRALIEIVYDVPPQDTESIRKWAKDRMSRDSAQEVEFPTPEEEEFFAAGQESLSVYEDDSDCVCQDAKTRDGDGGWRAAIASKAEIDSLSKPTKKIAQAVLSKAFPLPASWRRSFSDDIMHQGEGLLKGLILLKANADGTVSMKEGGKLVNDSVLGIIREEY